MTMTAHDETTNRFFRCQEGGSTLGVSHAAMSEVVICGIPKLSSKGVASTE
jgi:hypothetical protein